MTQRLQELIWSELDGELNAAEARELADLRAETPDPLGLESPGEAEIRELAAQLAKVEDVEVPGDLKSKILIAVEARRRNESQESPAPFVIPPAARRPFFRAKWGYLAAGVVLGGFFVYQLASRTAGVPESELVGTIPLALPIEPAEPSVGIRPADGPVLPEYMRIAVRDRFLDISLELGAGSTTLSLRAPGLAVEQVEFFDGARGRHEAGEDRISVEATGPGRAELVLVAPDPSSPIRVSVSGEGIQSFDSEFSFDQLSTNLQDTDR